MDGARAARSAAFLYRTGRLDPLDADGGDAHRGRGRQQPDIFGARRPGDGDMTELAGGECVAGGKVSGTVSWPPTAQVPPGPVAIWLVWHLAVQRGGMFEAGSSVTEDYTVVAWFEHVPARSIPFDFSILAEGPVS